jgi:hypothetical protein
VIFEEFEKRFELAFVLTIRIRFSESLHFREVLPHCDMESWLFWFFAGGFEAQSSPLTRKVRYRDGVVEWMPAFDLVPNFTII